VELIMHGSLNILSQYFAVMNLVISYISVRFWVWYVTLSTNHWSLSKALC